MTGVLGMQSDMSLSKYDDDNVVGIDDDDECM